MNPTTYAAAVTIGNGSQRTIPVATPSFANGSASSLKEPYDFFRDWNASPPSQPQLGDEAGSMPLGSNGNQAIQVLAAASAVVPRGSKRAIQSCSECKISLEAVLTAVQAC